MGTRNSSKKKNFSINKWYLDCVTEQGDCFIFYVVRLGWRHWYIDYSASLIKEASKKSVYTSKLIGVRQPKERNDQIRWGDAQFKVNGRWNYESPELDATLFEDEIGTLNWHCFQPKSRVQLKYKDMLLNGVGYAERLELDTLPWNIPMDELRWGRFHSEKYSVVWIEYKREETKQWVWVNGKRSFDWKVTDQYLENATDTILLELKDTTTLEAEQKIFNVLKGLFRFLPGFSGIIPYGFLTAEEQKWLSKGHLKVEDEMVEGWAIHELVKFNGRK